MGSNILLKSAAIKLRKEGKSYSEILRLLNLPSKGTLSLWFKNIKLNRQEESRLSKNMKLAVDRGLHKFNEIRSKRILEENIQAGIEGSGEIKKISKRELMLIGATLYWGEGSKADYEWSSKAIIFTNSDPNMIVVFMRFIREIWNIGEKRIRAGIHIYSNIKPDEAKKYWAEIMKLPIDRFYIVNQVSKASQNKRPLNILPYGTAVIKVNSRKFFYKIKGMIKGIVDNLKIV
jgi:hypothetical protein